jgi:hypothetical protein
MGPLENLVEADFLLIAVVLVATTIITAAHDHAAAGLKNSAVNLSESIVTPNQIPTVTIASGRRSMQRVKTVNQGSSVKSPSFISERKRRLIDGVSKYY